MIEEIQIIVDAIKINIEIAKVDGKPLIAEVSMNEKSKEYIAQLIEEYGNRCYLDGWFAAHGQHVRAIRGEPSIYYFFNGYPRLSVKTKEYFIASQLFPFEIKIVSQLLFLIKTVPKFKTSSKVRVSFSNSKLEKTMIFRESSIVKQT